MPKMNAGDVYGDLVIVEDRGWDKVLVRFIATGYERVTRRDHIKNGNIKDNLKPVVCNVGFIGDGKYSCAKHMKTYKRWSHMLSRCYLSSDKEYSRYGARGVVVAPVWHNFQNFAKWVEQQCVPDDYQLDKDIKVKGNLVYSPDVCLLVSPQQNAEAANAKAASFICPEGNIYHTDNMSKFAREHNLNAGKLSNLYTKKAKTHKGWRLYEDHGL